MKTILLKCDEAFFYKMKADKLRREREMERSLSWEAYIEVLFGLSKKLN